MKSFWRSILAFGMRFLAYFLLLFATVICASFVGQLVHTVAIRQVRLSWFAMGLGNCGLVALWLSIMALVSWFALDEWLLRKACADGGVRAWRSTLKAFLVVAALTLVGIILFWTLDGLRDMREINWQDPFIGGTVVASASLLAAIAVCAYGLVGGRRAKAVALIVPLAVMAVQFAYMAGLNNLADWGFDPWKNYTQFGLKWSTMPIICFAAGAVCLFAWLERRAFGGTWRAAALAFGCLWAWVFFQNCATLTPFYVGIHFTSVEAGQDRAQELAGWLVAAVWLAAVIVRLYLHRRWKRTQSEANQPAPVSPA
jgi:hypothetical protein